MKPTELETRLFYKGQWVFGKYLFYQKENGVFTDEALRIENDQRAEKYLSKKTNPIRYDD